MLNNRFVSKNRGGYRLQLVCTFFSIFVLLLLSRSIPVYAASGTVANEDFVFDASIDEKLIKDGTGPFDVRQEDGYDVSNHNGIVRTFDTVTYPLKITINPKKASSLKKIKLKITGSLENGVTDKKRVNAVFSLGNKTDILNNRVTFTQNYTIQQTGNSIKLPIVVEIKGATNGLKIRPNINVEVVSVDGVAVKDKVKVVLNDLPYVTVSAKVNVEARLSGIYGTNGDFARGIDPRLAKDDQSIVKGASAGFFITPLNGQDTNQPKGDMKGVTFPDGEIQFHFEYDGTVYWDEKPSQKIDFSDVNYRSPEIFSLYDIGNGQSFKGMKNTLSEGLDAFEWRYGYTTHDARSKLPSFDQNAINTLNSYSVWDSGIFLVNKSKMVNGVKQTSVVNRDFVIGSTFPKYRADGPYVTAYSTNQLAFSTVGLIMLTPNEFGIGQKHNKEGLANNVIYKLKIIIDSYKDSKGVVHALNTAPKSMDLVERNNPAGTFSFQNKFLDINGNHLGSVQSDRNVVSNGDSTIIRNKDVRFQGYLYGDGFFALGGTKHFFYWNPDSFELTKEYVEQTKQQFLNGTYRIPEGTDSKENVSVLFGVLKDTDYQVSALVNKVLEDFNWYDSYDEARKHGKVAAIQEDIHAALGTRVISFRSVKLHVLTKRLGSLNEKNTYNMVFQKAYMYPTKTRDKGFYVYNDRGIRGFTHPSIYDDLGNLVDKQVPVGSTINFDTLGIVNGNLSTDIQSDKNVYYSTDTMNWSVENRSVLPNNVNFNEGEKVTFTQKIPKGLTYVQGSYKLNEKIVEPKVTLNEDGSTELRYEYYLSSSVKTIPNIRFQTKVNPVLLDGGNQQDLTVTSIIDDPDLDTREVKFRTGTKVITIAKVGMVGVNSSLIPNSGKKNSKFTLRLQPYTTIDDEPNVRGVFQMPENKDVNGSAFSGSAYLKAIRSTVPANKTLKVYVSDTRVDESNPNKINITKAPWRAIDLNGSNDAFKNAKTIYFEVQGLLAKSDVVTLDFDIQTSGNNFGDLYFMKASLNSDSHYKLSPESNKVRYEIVPDATLKFQVIRMYTDKASKGIKGNVTISKEIYDKKSNNKPVDLVIFDKTTNKEVYRKSYTIGTIPDNLNFNVLPKDLTVNVHHNYEARFERYDTDVVFVSKDYEKIDVDGYTSSELLLKSTNDAIKYKGVIMTERVIGQDMTYKYETLNVDALKNIKTKSGYGINVNQQLKVKYKNDFDKDYEVKTALDIDKALASSELNYGNGIGSMKRVKLTDQLLEGQFTYELPEVMVHKGDGKLAFVNENNRSNIDWLNGGKQLYIPIWIKALQKYPIDFVSTNEIGINAVNFDSKAYVDVYAYMYEASESETVQHDEVMLKPEMQN